MHARMILLMGSYLGILSWLNACGDDFRLSPDPVAEAQTGPERAAAHVPVCARLGEPDEGWYWNDTGLLIQKAGCASRPVVSCKAIGDLDEGWYDWTGLIALDNCHQTLGIAIENERCGSAMGLACHAGLTCRPTGGDPALGTCKPQLWCDSESDCEYQAEAMAQPDSDCQAVIRCAQNRCAWRCPQSDQPADDPVQPENPPPESRVWVDVAIEQLESAHPYPDDQSLLWELGHQGALRFQLHFVRVETERKFDTLRIWGDQPAQAVILNGTYQDYWTPEIAGDMAHLAFESDFMLTDWGFKVDQVRFQVALPAGNCLSDEDCGGAGCCSREPEVDGLIQLGLCQSSGQTP
jgi:hypothetical protein